MKKVAALLALAFASIALVACGSSSSSSSSTTTEAGGEATGGAAAETGKSESGGGSTLKVETDPGGELAFTTTKATAKAGKVTVDFTNPQQLTHNVAIENSKGEKVGETELIAGGSDSTTVNLKPGTYHYFCTVPGHREAGMEGTLTVK